jgi:hypothetical protein
VNFGNARLYLAIPPLRVHTSLRSDADMPQAIAGPEIERLIQLLRRLPGLGPRSRAGGALHLIKRREQLLAP